MRGLGRKTSIKGADQSDQNHPNAYNAAEAQGVDTAKISCNPCPPFVPVQLSQ